MLFFFKCPGYLFRWAMVWLNYLRPGQTKQAHVQTSMILCIQYIYKHVLKVIYEAQGLGSRVKRCSSLDNEYLHPTTHPVVGVCSILSLALCLRCTDNNHRQSSLSKYEMVVVYFL